MAISTPFDPDRPYPDLDLRRQPSGLAGRPRPLAGRHPRGRRQAVGCAARAPDRTFRRPPHQRIDAAACERTRCWKPKSENRRSGRRGACDRPARRVHVRPRRRRGGLRGQGAAGRGAEGAGRRNRSPRRQACRRRRTSSSCWPPTAPCAGSATRSAKLVAGDNVLRAAAAHHRRRAADRARRAMRCRRGSTCGCRPISSKLLGPLFELAAAEDITGIARGIAFQLVEALGVLERQKVADEVKGLDQPSRASLRKYGVRFGAYHIYVPSLLKPAPRALAAQLWALKHGEPETPRGFDDCSIWPPAAAPRFRSTRRSSATLYRTIGYRRVRRARGAGRHPRTARRPDPPGAGLARRLRPASKPGRRLRRPRLHRDPGDDLADRFVGGRFRLDPARARLSNGEAAAAAGGDRRRRRCRRSSRPREAVLADGEATAATETVAAAEAVAATEAAAEPVAEAVAPNPLSTVEAHVEAHVEAAVESVAEQAAAAAPVEAAAVGEAEAEAEAEAGAVDADETLAVEAGETSEPVVAHADDRSGREGCRRRAGRRRGGSGDATRQRNRSWSRSGGRAGVPRNGARAITAIRSMAATRAAPAAAGEAREPREREPRERFGQGRRERRDDPRPPRPEVAAAAGADAAQPQEGQRARSAQQPARPRQRQGKIPRRRRGGRNDSRPPHGQRTSAREPAAGARNGRSIPIRRSRSWPP